MQNKNLNLHKAKRNKNDEFYTQYDDIEKEINAYLEFDLNTFKDKVILLPCDDPEWSNFTRYFVQNFDKLGLKKLISTSYAIDGGLGKIFVLDKNANNNGVDINNLKWEYLKGNGDFRSDEIKALRDESDIIMTNPPFSLFREFLAWIVEAGKKFAVIGNMNAITYKGIFPLIKENKMWLGGKINNGNGEFIVPPHYIIYTNNFRIDENGIRYILVNGVKWFTNIELNQNHTPLHLSKTYTPEQYPKYDNYDAIEVSKTKDIPIDYTGVMGVPISFLDKYCPDQFEVLGISQRGCHDSVPDIKNIMTILK